MSVSDCLCQSSIPIVLIVYSSFDSSVGAKLLVRRFPCHVKGILAWLWKWLIAHGTLSGKYNSERFPPSFLAIATIIARNALIIRSPSSSPRLLRHLCLAGASLACKLGAQLSSSCTSQPRTMLSSLCYRSVGRSLSRCHRTLAPPWSATVDSSRSLCSCSSSHTAPQSPQGKLLGRSRRRRQPCPRCR